METNEILRKLEPLRPRQVEQWRLTLEVADAEVRFLVERQIRKVARDVLGKDFSSRVLLSLPPKERSKGTIELGTLIYEKPKWPFGLSTNEFLQNISVFGRSGAGKTNVVFHLLQQLSAIRIPFLFLDWKRTGRHLAPHLKTSPQIFTPGRSLAPFPFNPLIVPPGVETDAYGLYIIDLLAQSYTLGDGAKSLLQRALTACYARHTAPTFDDLLRALDASNTKGREIGWMQSARRAIESVALSTRDIDSKSQQELAKRLLTQSTIVELDGLSTNAKTFLIPLLCCWIYSARLSSASREDLRYVMVFEEAHHVLYRHEHRGSETLMNTLLRQGRELGISSIVVDQHPHLISSAALGNCYTTICLNLKDPSDHSKAAGLSLVSDSEKRFFSVLPVGQGIVKLQDRFTEPFLVQFPLHPVQKGAVTDAMISRLNQGKTSWRTVRERLATDSRVARRSRLGAIPVEEAAFVLLHDVVNHPADGVDVRYKRLNFSAALGNRLKQQLLDNNLALAERVKVGRTHRVVLCLTDEARRLLIDRPGRDPQASFLHEYWKQIIASVYDEHGFAVKVEAQRESGGGNIDILATRASETLAIEIETGKSDVVSNVKRDLLCGVSRVIVVTTTEGAYQIVERQLAKSGLLLPGRVEVTTGPHLLSNFA